MLDPQRSDFFEAVILDHNERPRHFHKMEEATHSAEGVNPVCGDRFRIYLVIDGQTIERASFFGRGCALSKASASMMVSMAAGHTVEELSGLRDVLYESLTSQPDADPGPLGEMESMLGVRDHPSRIRCVMLGWNTLLEATTDLI
jgi:nitrogen fixation NifU-like protein